MYFPVADISVSPFIPPLVAFVVSFFTSMGGISGAFLLLPFQMSALGYVHPSVSATNQVFNIVAIPSGVMRLRREKRLVWPLVFIICAGTLPGVFVGALARIVWMPDPAVFKPFAGLVLLYIGARLLLTTVKTWRKGGKASSPKGGVQGAVSQAVTGGVTVLEFTLRRLVYRFEGREISCSPSSLFLLSLVVGCIGGAYGIGGGAIITPFLVVWFGLPVHTTGGATLLATFLTSVAGVTFYSFLAPYFPDLSVAPDWKLGFLFGLGGLFGIYFGARCQKFVPARAIQLGLGLVIVFVGVRYIAA